MTGIKTFGNNETAETIIRMQNVNLVYPTGTAALKDCSLEIGKSLCLLSGAAARVSLL